MLALSHFSYDIGVVLCATDKTMKVSIAFEVRRSEKSFRRHSNCLSHYSMSFSTSATCVKPIGSAENTYILFEVVELWVQNFDSIAHYFLSEFKCEEC